MTNTTERVRSTWTAFQETSLDRSLAPEHEIVRDEILDRLVTMQESLSHELGKLGSPHMEELRLDGLRTNRVLLIDGARGSGKTTALLHVLRELKTKPGVVPGALIDLDTLPADTPILTHLVAELCRLRLRVDSSGDELGEAWHELAAVVGTSWPGNLAARRPHLDPAEYAIELDDSSRRRLDLGSTFRTFIEELSRRWTQLRKSELAPLFVIAIDDADMQPARLKDLAHSLRLLWHPSLAFVLTGDVTLFRRGLRAWYATQVDAMVDTNPNPVDGGTLLAQQIADEMLDKTIPLTHRVRLHERAPLQRLAFLIEHLDDSRLEPSTHAVLNYRSLPAAFPPHFRELAQVVDQLSQLKGNPIQRLSVGEAVWRAACDRHVWLPKLLTRHPPQWWLSATEYRISYARRVAYASGVTAPDLAEPTLTAPDGTLLISRDEVGASDRLVAALGLLILCSALARVSDPFRWASFGHLPGLITVQVPPTHAALGAVTQFVDWSDAAGATLECLVLMDQRISSLRCDDAARFMIAAASTLRAGPNKESAGPAGAWQSAFHTDPPAADQLPWLGQQLDVIWQSDRKLCIATALMCAPEAGLGATEANRLLSDLREAISEPRLVELSDEIRQHRSRRAKRSLAALRRKVKEDADHWLKRIDNLESGRSYEYVQFLEKRGPLTATEPSENREKLERMRRVHQQLPHGPLELLPSLADVDRQNPGLSFYLTDERQTWVAREATGDEIDTLLEAALEVPRGRGTVPFQLQHLWEAVGAPQARPGSGGFLLRFRTDGRVIVTTANVPPPVLARNRSVPLTHVKGGRVTLTFEPLQWTWSEPLSELSPIQRLIWSVAWDYSSDRGWLTTRGESDGWPGLKIDLSGSALSIRWPVPKWPALMDDELLMVAWERVRKQADELARLLEQQDTEDGGGDAASRIADALAFWYVQTIFGIASSRGGYAELDMRSPSEVATDYLNASRLPSNLMVPDSGDARGQAFRQFLLESVPLLAAPESGMSRRGADALLGGWWKLISAHQLRPNVGQIMAQRKDRARLGLGHDPTTLLNELDRAAPFGVSLRRLPR